MLSGEVHVARATGSVFRVGASLYFWARLAYLPIYILGIPYLRTLVWVVSFWGLLRVLGALW